jgi:hypothetical protein
MNEWFWWEGENRHCYSRHSEFGIVDDGGLCPAVVRPNDDGICTTITWYGPDRTSRALRGAGEETIFPSLSDAKKYIEVEIQLERGES